MALVHLGCKGVKEKIKREKKGKMGFLNPVEKGV